MYKRGFPLLVVFNLNPYFGTQFPCKQQDIIFYKNGSSDHRIFCVYFYSKESDYYTYIVAILYGQIVFAENNFSLVLILNFILDVASKCWLTEIIKLGAIVRNLTILCNITNIGFPSIQWKFGINVWVMFFSTWNIKIDSVRLFQLGIYCFQLCNIIICTVNKINKISASKVDTMNP